MRVLEFLRPPVVAIDVGTATTRVFFGSSRIVECPSVSRDRAAGKGVPRPIMRSGVVADIAGVASVVEELLDGRRRAWRRRPAAIVCTPTDVTVQERDALIEAVVGGGASVVTVVPEPLAAAIGIGIDVASEYATAIVDLGEGVTDMAVIRDGSIIRSAAFRVGCGTLRAAIHDWLELRTSALLSNEAVERIVRAYCMESETPDGVGLLLDPVINRIAQFVADTIQELPDALAAEVIESGIHVAGGGAMLGRLVREIERVVGMPLKRADQPLTAVIRGSGEMLRVLLRDRTYPR